MATAATSEKPRWQLFSGNSIDRHAQVNGWLFIFPAVALVGFFMIYPIVWSLWMSFQTGRGMNLSFGGLANINRLLQDPILLRALGNTFIFLLIRTRLSKFTPAQATAAIVVSYYWHFVDIVWIALFAVIYFVR